MPSTLDLVSLCNNWKDREQRLKKGHSIVKSISSKSGFGWNPDKGVPTAPEEKWKELPREHQKWRYKSFPYYDDLYDIYDGMYDEPWQLLGYIACL